jgi:hypothetical protein
LCEQRAFKWNAPRIRVPGASQCEGKLSFTPFLSWQNFTQELLCSMHKNCPTSLGHTPMLYPQRTGEAVPHCDHASKSCPPKEGTQRVSVGRLPECLELQKYVNWTLETLLQVLIFVPWASHPPHLPGLSFF